MMTPNMPTPSTNEHSEQTAMMRLLNNVSGMIGSSTRASLAMKAASITADNISSGMTRTDDHPCSGAHVRASSSGTTVAVSSANPLQSIAFDDPLFFMFGN